MLVIFDCDGVLLDSEVIALAVDAMMLTKLGLPHTIDDVAGRFLGVSAKTANLMIEKDLGGPIPEWFEEEYQIRLNEEFEASLKPIKGVNAVLENFPYPKCVASSSSMMRLEKTLKMTKLYDYFDPHIYSSELVARGKPHPDLFYYAAQNMGTLSNGSIVIEDSVNGVRASVAAGITCLGFFGGSHCNKFHAQMLLEAGAEEVFDNMGAVVDILSRYEKLAA